MGMNESKRGRPSLGRTEYLEVRLTPEEKFAFENAARASGISLSDWVRLNLRASTAAEAQSNVSVSRFVSRTK
jgi:hypothetical protein